MSKNKDRDADSYVLSESSALYIAADEVAKHALYVAGSKDQAIRIVNNSMNPGIFRNRVVHHINSYMGVAK